MTDHPRMFLAVLSLALRSAVARRLTLGITLCAIAVSSALLLAVERVRHDARASFAQSISGVDLVIGARSGSVQLVLHAVFHSGSATHNIRWESFTAIASNPAVDWAVPLSLGDGHRGFPVLGTTTGYFRHFRHGAGKPLLVAAGAPFAGVLEAVLGSEVAAQLGYRVGDRLLVNHGVEALAPEHDDKPLRVVGILARTGTPVDRTVHVSLETITALHLDWVGGAPLPGLQVPAEHVGKFDLQAKEITAVLVGLKNRADVFRVQRQINGYRGEPLLAVLPGVALDELWQTLAMVEGTLFVLSALVVVVGLAGLLATMLAGLNERRRELAILRSLGAGPRDIFLMLTFEGLLVTTIGVLAGVALLAVALPAFAPLAEAHFGVHLSWRMLSGNEFALLASILATGLLANLIPGWRAWRMSLADGLTPRT